ncbi:MAG: hypothetical protein GX434_03695 [Peptococcaceae bacterium]|nr:hypothetical protein [Peptococcaceae bacterium]
MYRTSLRKSLLWIFPAAVLCFVLMLSGIVAGKEVLPDNKVTTAGSAQINMETLEKLFSLVQKIEGMENEQTELSKDIETLKKEIEELKKAMSEEEIVYSQKKENLKQFLQVYQRMGPGSYLEIILASDDLADFLRRLNILRDITGNTGKLLDQIQSSREKQSAETMKLTEKLGLIQDKQQRLKDALASEIQLKSGLENNLAALAGEKGYYQESLAEMKQKWDDLKPFFALTVKEFSRVLEEGNIPPGALKLTASFFSITATMSDQSLNEIVAGDPRLPQMVFSFHPGEAEINIPEKHLVLKGIFVIQEGHILQFQAQSGTFYGLPLEESSLAELFRKEQLKIDCKSVLGGYTLNSIEIRDGSLKLSVIPG